KSAPAVVRFVAGIAARFGLVVSEEIAAKAVPVIGAASGSVINVLFMDHFQDMARGHFIVRRLENKYGTPLVRAEYLELPG
ncbi:MAG TPA: EcsC family protein, partial [Candidatus Saccharimonadales bacterium]|nr:EcsC family protein [Candidatus Saccharimonadales bacterium]